MKYLKCKLPYMSGIGFVLDQSAWKKPRVIGVEVIEIAALDDCKEKLDRACRLLVGMKDVMDHDLSIHQNSAFHDEINCLLLQIKLENK